jgi:hypothetical protein
MITENLPQNILSETAHPNMSAKYSFVNSLQIAETLESRGWNLVNASSRKSKFEDRNKYSMHWMRFRNESTKLKNVDDMIPEIYCRNSHDGSSATVFEAGIFRLICTNGLVVKDSSFGSLSLRHAEKNVKALHEYLDQFVNGFQNVGQKIERMQLIKLEDSQAIEFAKKSMALLWGEQTPGIEVSEVLNPRRPEDKSMDLWSTYNRVQENLSKGGLTGLVSTQSLTKKNTVRRTKTRGIKDSFRYVNFNSKLWELTESYI